ncbi:hypothetical Protein YC6258_02073 [Gynuella sunshinyii YC6258]|uniref:Uncharacterized protein n=1 Tax=Gynuella sunshinyii YC6258 TaxID=1445510 RepID=A0A0C5VHG5_9GAMM|nr:hypothetical Protein YC6258_02073 [Gynuella sunshinyii YC6258]
MSSTFHFCQQEKYESDFHLNTDLKTYFQKDDAAVLQRMNYWRIKEFGEKTILSGVRQYSIY